VYSVRNGWKSGESSRRNRRGFWDGEGL